MHLVSTGNFDDQVCCEAVVLAVDFVSGEDLRRDKIERLVIPLIGNRESVAQPAYGVVGEDGELRNPPPAGDRPF